MACPLSHLVQNQVNRRSPQRRFCFARSASLQGTIAAGAKWDDQAESKKRAFAPCTNALDHEAEIAKVQEWLGAPTSPRSGSTTGGVFGMPNDAQSTCMSEGFLGGTESQQILLTAS